MRVEPQFHQHRQQVVGAGDVVVHGVALVRRVAHRIGRRALLGEVDHRVGPDLAQQLAQERRVLRDVHRLEADVPVHAASRDVTSAIGVRLPAPSSASMRRRERLSTMVT